MLNDLSSRNEVRDLEQAESLPKRSRLCAKRRQIGKHFYFAIHFLKYWRVELVLMQQLHFRLNFRSQGGGRIRLRHGSVLATFQFWLKNAKLQLDVIKIV
jgi:hypothetical protein